MIVKDLSDGYLEKLAHVVDEYRAFCGFEKSYEETKAFFQTLLRQNDSATFIAINSDDAVMGFINLYPCYSTLALRKIWILNDLGVSPRFRRSGVAIALIKKAVDFAKTTGAVRIELKTERTNFNAQKLYSDLGFNVDQDNIYYRVPVQ